MPQEHHDELVRALVAPGWPAVRERMPEIVSWLADPNCTGCWVALEFCRKLGAEFAPYARDILRGKDADVRYVALTNILNDWARDQLAPIEPELSELATGSDSEGAWLEALALLVRNGLGDRPRLQRRVAGMITARRSDLAELEELQRLLEKEPA
jgi:hypothetical protein